MLTSDQPVVLSVDPGSRTRFALQFTPPVADPAATGIAAGDSRRRDHKLDRVIILVEPT